MGNNKITSLAQGTASGDAVAWEQLFSLGAEVDVASAATTDIGVVNSTLIRITGTTTITSFGATYRGPRLVRFGGALQLTHNATTLILPGAANITTAAGDCAIVRPVGSPGAGWVVMHYQRAAAPVDVVFPSRWLTGEWVIYPGSLPAGCVVPNGGTIGNALSGATNRANADTAALFEFYWGLTTNTDYPIQDSAGAPTTRGASAAADFAANKRFPLPNIQDGDALVASTSSAVLTRTAGEVIAHTHSVTDPGHTHLQTRLNITGSGTGGGGVFQGTDSNGPATTAATTGITIASTGGTKNKAAGLFTKVYVAL
jgi:hypothetical protein